ncbi:MAG: hypothetical protein HY907_14615 [Deltaproteobacteria bacterium]|nr:hypothetical protein [Deltaproteobacteria bacterium]
MDTDENRWGVETAPAVGGRRSAVDPSAARLRSRQAGSGQAGLPIATLLALAVAASCDSTTDQAAEPATPGSIETSVATPAGGEAVEALKAPVAVQHRTVVDVQAPADERPVRYAPWAIELEVGATPIAAYQVELVVKSGDATVVGVEGGTTDGFREPPFFDPKALAGGRIVLAAFNTKVGLSRGRHRVATLHMREAGPAPAYELRLVAAASPDGSPADVDIDLVSGKGRE